MGRGSMLPRRVTKGTELCSAGLCFLSKKTRFFHSVIICQAFLERLTEPRAV